MAPAGSSFDAIDSRFRRGAEGRGVFVAADTATAKSALDGPLFPKGRGISATTGAEPFLESLRRGNGEESAAGIDEGSAPTTAALL